jgi:hypothetical protein
VNTEVNLLYINIKNVVVLKVMEIVDMEEFEQTIYQKKKEMRKKDEKIEYLMKQMKDLEELVIILKKQLGHVE